MKTKFSQLNDKRLYYPDGIVSLPFGHKNLKQIDNFKKEKGQKIEKYFWEEKEVLFKMEKEAMKNNPRLCLYHQIIMFSPKIFNINQKNDFIQQKKTLLKRNTKDIILMESGFGVYKSLLKCLKWVFICCLMENFIRKPKRVG